MIRGDSVGPPPSSSVDEARPKIRPSQLPLSAECVYLSVDDGGLGIPRMGTASGGTEHNRLMRFKIPPYDTASKDSDSLINDSYYYETEGFDVYACWWSHPKVRQNWKIVVSAFVLLIIGVGLVATGLVVEIMPIAGFKGIVFFMAGAICFIPGAYHVVYVYCAVKGRRGFDFSSLPLFT